MTLNAINGVVMFMCTHPLGRCKHNELSYIMETIIFRSQDSGNSIRVLDLRQWASIGTNWLATHEGLVFTRAPSSTMDEFA
jgi:hypothetical protein